MTGLLRRSLVLGLAAVAVAVLAVSAAFAKTSRTSADVDVCVLLPDTKSSVRYTLAHAIGREPDRVQIRIGRLVHDPGIPPEPDPASPEPGPSDLAASGTDVA